MQVCMHVYVCVCGWVGVGGREDILRCHVTPKKRGSSLGTQLISFFLSSEECTFSRECLGHYQGNTVIHIGELLGETCSANPWGQTSSRDFQLKLVEQFRCVCRVELPNWPGHMDSLTIWSRVSSSQDCDGADMKFVHIKLPRYFGWKESIAT